MMCRMEPSASTRARRPAHPHFCAPWQASAPLGCSTHSARPCPFSGAQLSSSFDLSPAHTCAAQSTLPALDKHPLAFLRPNPTVRNPA
eukprot:366568-Chlamydomonas_euryale.AAC.23